MHFLKVSLPYNYIFYNGDIRDPGDVERTFGKSFLFFL